MARTVTLFVLVLLFAPSALSAQSGDVELDFTVIQNVPDGETADTGDRCTLTDDDGRTLRLEIIGDEDFEPLLTVSLRGEVVESDGTLRCEAVVDNDIDRQEPYFVAIGAPNADESLLIDLYDADELESGDLVIDLDDARAAAEATPEGILPPDATPAFATPVADSDEVILDIRATDIELFTWVDDTTCVLGLKGYDMYPMAQIFDDQGDLVEEYPLWEQVGEVTLVERTEEEIEDLERESDYDVSPYRADLCRVLFPIDDLPNGDYTIVIDPLIEEEVALAAGSSVVLDMDLPEDEELPSIYERPSGLIPGTGLYRIAGTFELLGTNGEEYFNLGLTGCEGQGGYSDIRPGAQIRIENEAGELLDVAELTDQFILDGSCLFTFTADVPEARFYSVSFGERGEFAYSFEDMEDRDWRIDLSVGE